MKHFNIIVLVALLSGCGAARGLLTDEIKSVEEALGKCEIEREYRKFPEETCQDVLADYEAAVEAGIVYDADSLRDFIEARLRERLREGLKDAL